jgi:hypothetical protein
MEQAWMAILQQAQYLEEGAEKCAEGHYEDAKRWTNLHH